MICYLEGEPLPNMAWNEEVLEIRWSEDGRSRCVGPARQMFIQDQALYSGQLVDWAYYEVLGFDDFRLDDFDEQECDYEALASEPEAPAESGCWDFLAPKVSYSGPGWAPGVRAVQLAKDPLPSWAVDVRME